MRVPVYCALLVLSALGASFGQDTDFAHGPQYLITGGTPAGSNASFFQRSISTPSMSLSGPALEVGASDATGDLTAGAETQTVVLAEAVALPQADLFSIYYGVVPVNVIEISFPEAPEGSSFSGGLPASILDSGVWQITTAQALRERGYGVTMPEAARYDKAHVRHGGRIYTNADIDRLHGAS